MSGTNVRYAATSDQATDSVGGIAYPLMSYAMYAKLLRTCYAMSGPEIQYDATRMLCDIRYKNTVVRLARVLGMEHALGQLRYVPTRALRDDSTDNAYPHMLLPGELGMWGILYGAGHIQALEQ
eukprot:326057-Rhodomonas_salina.1